MSAPRYRVIRPNSPAGEPTANSDLPIDLDASESVAVSAGETLALMLHAVRTDRVWIRDFADETIRVSRDMYELLLHYKRIVHEENSRAA